MPLDTVEKLGEGGPVPGHPGLHRCVRDRLHARHGEHGTLASIRMHGGEAEAAVADDDRSHSVPARDRAVRIPEELRVIMSVQIHETGRDDHPGSVYDPGGFGRTNPADPGDTTIFDSDVAAKARHPGSVNDHSVAD